MNRIILFIFVSLLLVGYTFNETIINEQNHYTISKPLISSTTNGEHLQTNNDYLVLIHEEVDELEFHSKTESHTKEIKTGVFQSVYTDTDDDGEIVNIQFRTWLLDKSGKTLIDISSFNDNILAHGTSIGKNYYDLWIELPNFYLSYHDLNLNFDFLNMAKKGKMYTSNVTIGFSKEQLISKVGQPIISDWYHGGTYYFYNDIGFILDDNKVAAINLPGNRINISLNEVPLILGEPTSKLYFEYDNLMFYTYELENYSLSFEAVNEEKKVENIWLMKN